jgi:hypothetical protein
MIVENLGELSRRGATTSSKIPVQSCYYLEWSLLQADQCVAVTGIFGRDPETMHS